MIVLPPITKTCLPKLTLAAPPKGMGNGLGFVVQVRTVVAGRSWTPPGFNAPNAVRAKPPRENSTFVSASVTVVINASVDGVFARNKPTTTMITRNVRTLTNVRIPTSPHEN